MLFRPTEDEIAAARLDGLVTGLSMMSQALPAPSARAALRAVQNEIRAEIKALERMYWPHAIAAGAGASRSRVAAMLAQHIADQEKRVLALVPLIAEAVEWT